jgi:hypothetical protein
MLTVACALMANALQLPLLLTWLAICGSPVENAMQVPCLFFRLGCVSVCFVLLSQQAQTEQLPKVMIYLVQGAGHWDSIC